MYRVGQRFMPGLVPLPRASQTITPNYPGPYTFQSPRPVREQPRPEVYGIERFIGEGSQGYWVTVGSKVLPPGYTLLDKTKIGCEILKTLVGIWADPWVRGVHWHDGNRYDEFPNRLSQALAKCAQFGF